MMMNAKTTQQLRRGDIYFADLSPAVGSEQNGCRPVLIIQNDQGNRCSPTVIVAAITGHIKAKRLPTHVLLDPKNCCVKMHSTILLEQIRTLDRSRLKNYVGRLPHAKMQDVDAAICASIGIGA